MEHKYMVLCDPEEDYIQHMADFLRKKKDAAWEIVTYTKPEELVKFEENIEILMIAESVYGAFVSKLPVELPILLNESGMIQEKDMANIDKYQEAERVRQEMLNYYMEREKEYFPRLACTRAARLIGMYSPVKRCMQTTFAITYGQLLAENHRTLYLSFEQYAGWEEWRECQRQDLSALLYFQQTDGDGFRMHVQAMVQRMGNLEYIAPMVNGENLLYITAKEWQRLLRELMEIGEYEYIILDLSESMQGLFEILRMCHRIYTIVQEDFGAKSKINQYEYLLTIREYKDVWDKTARCRLPVFHKLPECVEQYTKGELADYIRGMLESEEQEWIMQSGSSN